MSTIGNAQPGFRSKTSFTQAIVFGHNLPTFLDWTDMILAPIPMRVGLALGPTG